MAVTAILARDFKFEIDTGTTGTPEWVEIKGINSFSWDSSKNDADTTTFQDDGVQSHIVASRGYELTLEGLLLEDPDTGERDPGQKAVEELASKIGPASIGNFRMTYPSGKVKGFKASANIGGPGGGNDDPASWSVTLTISGKPEEIETP